MLDRLAEDFCLEVIETPVGFNHISDHMLADDVLIGGEESGGISFKGHIPEGDGILIGLLITEMVSEYGAPLEELVDDLQAQYGPVHYSRLDMRLSRPIEKTRLVAQLTENAPASIGGGRVAEVQSLDGVKYILDDDSWLLIRPSGTEPVLRVYAECRQPEMVDALIAYGQSVAEGRI
jgi:phosphomannomutase